MPEVVNEVFRTVSKRLHTENRYTNYLKSIENTLGFKREYIFTVIVLLVGAYLSVGESAEFICNFATVIYPTCASIKAIEQNNSEAIQKMLIYWAIFGILRFVEYFSNIIRCWIPCYWIFKVVLLLLCFVPIPNNLGTYIYYQILLPKMQNIVNMLIYALAKDTQIVATTTKELALIPLESHMEPIIRKGDIQSFHAGKCSDEFKKSFEEKASKLSIDQKEESRISSLLSKKEFRSSKKELLNDRISINQSVISSQRSEPEDIQKSIKQDKLQFPSILMSAEEEPFALSSHEKLSQTSTQLIPEYLLNIPSREMEAQLPITLSQNSVISDKKIPTESFVSKRTSFREESPRASIQKKSSFIETEKNKFPDTFSPLGQMSSASVTVEKQASRASTIKTGKNILEVSAFPSRQILDREQASRDSIKIADTKIPKISSTFLTQTPTEQTSNELLIQNQSLKNSMQMENTTSKASPVSSEQFSRNCLQDSYLKLVNHEPSPRASVQIDNAKIPKVPSVSSRISVKQETEVIPVQEQISRTSIHTKIIETPEVSRHSSVKEQLNIQPDQEEPNKTIEMTLPEKNIMISNSQDIQLKRMPTDEELFKESEAILIPSKRALNTLAESIKETKTMDA